jgi:hypothetical protein
VTQAAQWFGLYDPTGSNSGTAKTYATSSYDYPGTYRVTRIQLNSPSGSAYFYPDGAVIRDGVGKTGEKHTVDFAALSYKFVNREMPQTSFTTAPKPLIEGTLAEGSTLTAKAGAWTPTPHSMQYQWYRDGKPIHDGAGTYYYPPANGPTYTLKSEDIGRAITVSVEGWSKDRKQTIVTSFPVSPKRYRVQAGTVSVTGNAVVDSVLKAVPAGWGKDVSLAYQWYAGTAAIPKATSATYTPTAGDLRKNISVKITGSKPGFVPITITSSESVVQIATFKRSPASIAGTPMVGKRLTAKHGIQTPQTTLGYQWTRGETGSDLYIPGATGNSYTPTAADRGKRLTVWVQATKRGYQPVDFAHTTSPVAYGNLSNASLKISGTTRVGKKLAASHGSFGSGTKMTYQWLRDGKNVSKATGKSYVPTASDRGKKLSVRVVAGKSGYKNLTRTSAKTATIGYGTQSAPSVKVTGTTKVGKRLTASHSVFITKPRVSYQWLRNGKNISRAVGKSYTLTKSDRGKKVSVRIVVKQTGYENSTRTSGTVSVR